MRQYFPRLFGNETTKSRIGKAIETATLPHALLIIGPEGSGKNTLALEIAAATNCERKGDPSVSLPCHTCNTCRRILAGEYTDVKTLLRQKDKATIGVDPIREFREDMFLSSTESEYKIYMINEADRMTPNAQNALLKVLEEPPQGVLIILLSATDDAILTTIKSRTQHIFMQRFDSEDLKKYLKSTGRIIGEGDKRITELLMSADGRIGRALELIGEGGKEAEEIRKTTEAIILALRKNTPYSALLTAIGALPTKKDEFTEAIESVISAIRDIILLKNSPDAPLVFYSDREAARALAEEFNTKRLLAIYDIMKNALEDSARNVNVPSLITVMGAKIKFI